MVEDDTEEGSGDKRWIDRTERAILDAPSNVSGEQREEPFIISFLGCFLACLAGKCLKSSASLTPAALAICFVVVPVKPFAANNDVAVLIKLACRSWLEVRDGWCR